MIVVLKPGAGDADVAAVLESLERRGLRGRVLSAGTRKLVHIVSGPTRRARRLLRLEQVEALVPTSGPRVREQGRRFYPYHFVNWSAAVVALLGLLVFLAGMYPPGLGAPIDVRHPPEVVLDPWYLRAPLRLVGWFPSAWIGWLVLALLGALVFFLPLWHRSRRGSARGSGEGMA